MGSGFAITWRGATQKTTQVRSSLWLSSHLLCRPTGLHCRPVESTSHPTSRCVAFCCLVVLVVSFDSAGCVVLQTIERWLKEAVVDRSQRRKGPGGEDSTGAGSTTRPGEEALDDELDVLVDAIAEQRALSSKTAEKQQEDNLTAVCCAACECGLECGCACVGLEAGCRGLWCGCRFRLQVHVHVHVHVHAQDMMEAEAFVGLKGKRTTKKTSAGASSSNGKRQQSDDYLESFWHKKFKTPDKGGGDESSSSHMRAPV